jgi:hypothetical protein
MLPTPPYPSSEASAACFLVKVHRVQDVDAGGISGVDVDKIECLSLVSIDSSDPQMVLPLRELLTFAS